MISPEDKTLIDETAREFSRKLDAHHVVGFGIFPSADPLSNYFDQLWARDAAHAAAHYFARTKPEAVIDSLRTILAHQRADGALPSRVERQYQQVRLTPGFRWLSRPLFNFVEVRIRKRRERPVHEGQDAAGGEDTIPAVLIMAGELFEAARESEATGDDGDAGRAFIKENFAKLKKAAEFFRATKTDLADGLAVMTRNNPDWADTIKRGGKLGVINIWWWRGLRHMETIARATGDDGAATQYHDEAEKVRGAIMEKIYDAERGFFRAKAVETAAMARASHEDRLDTVASIFGAIYFLNAGEATRVEEALQKRVGHTSGLQNFDPPYSPKDIFWVHRFMGQWIYHNYFVWPWVTLQNIHVKIKIAQEHKNFLVREQFQDAAIEDLIIMARLFRDAGGAYEVFKPDEPRRGETKFYHPPKNFMGTMAAYQGVYFRLKKLGWI